MVLYFEFFTSYLIYEVNFVMRTKYEFLYVITLAAAHSLELSSFERFIISANDVISFRYEKH